MLSLGWLGNSVILIIGITSSIAEIVNKGCLKIIVIFCYLIPFILQSPVYYFNFRFFGILLISLNMCFCVVFPCFGKYVLAIFIHGVYDIHCFLFRDSDAFPDNKHIT